jgi:hypothetical protein
MEISRTPGACALSGFEHRSRSEDLDIAGLLKRWSRRRRKPEQDTVDASWSYPTTARAGQMLYGNGVIVRAHVEVHDG